MFHTPKTDLQGKVLSLLPPSLPQHNLATQDWGSANVLTPSYDPALVALLWPYSYLCSSTRRRTLYIALPPMMLSKS